MKNIHWPAVAAAGLAYYLLGIPWFSPATLGPVWEQAIGFERPASHSAW